MSISTQQTISCDRELRHILDNRNIIDILAELMFKAVYDEEKKMCRNVSPLDRLATSISKYGAKVSLYEIKRGLLVERGGTSKGVDETMKNALKNLNTIEICLEKPEFELKALETLKTLALNALSKCLSPPE